MSQTASRAPRPTLGRTLTAVRPTARGATVMLLVIGLWLLGHLTNLQAPLELAAALLVLVLIAAVCVAIGSTRLSVRREIREDTVDVGAHVVVRQELARGSWLARLPTARAELTAHLPAALGGPATYPLTSPAMTRTLTVGRRGHHALGPLEMRLTDPFAIFRIRRDLDAPAQVTGLPELEEINPAALRRAHLARGDQGAQSGHTGIGEISPQARAYAPGDDIRRIHWRASARTGTLMTREEEPAQADTAVIVLDTRPPRSATVGDARTVRVQDRLVELAGTWLQALQVSGWDVRLVDAAGDEITRLDRPRTGGGSSVLHHESDAIGMRAARLALADLAFDTHPETTSAEPVGAGISLGVVLTAGGDAGGDPSGSEDEDDAGIGEVLTGLQRLVGRARRRLAVVIHPELAGSVGWADPSAPKEVPAQVPTETGNDEPHPVAASQVALPGGTWVVLETGAATPAQRLVEASTTASTGAGAQS